MEWRTHLGAQRVAVLTANIVEWVCRPVKLRHESKYHQAHGEKDTPRQLGDIVAQFRHGCPATEEEKLIRDVRCRDSQSSQQEAGRKDDRIKEA